MNSPTAILTITGSDNTGVSGIQADIKTIEAMKGYALTAVTAVTIQNTGGMLNVCFVMQKLLRLCETRL